jgi:uncharacterized phage protein (TIGR02218 family)
MKTISGPLQTLFNTKQFAYAGLYQFSLVTGTSLYYSSGDVDIFWNSNTYSCGGTVGPYLERGVTKAKMHQKVGVEVDTLVFDVIPGGGQVQGTGFLAACRQGIFDGAELTYSGAYWPQQAYANPVSPTGVVIKFVGRVAEVDFSRSLVTFTINSHLELLNQNMPRNLWSAGCNNTLYDASCTLLQSNFQTSGSVSSGSAASSINAALSAATGYFDLGILTFTSGVNNGISRTVKTYTNGSPSTVTLISPFPNAPATSDTFDIYPGCDKAQATCQNKFNNLVNFRGTPFVPEQATAV